MHPKQKAVALQQKDPCYNTQCFFFIEEGAGVRCVSWHATLDSALNSLRLFAQFA